MFLKWVTVSWFIRRLAATLYYNKSVDKGMDYCLSSWSEHYKISLGRACGNQYKGGYFEASHRRPDIFYRVYALLY